MAEAPAPFTAITYNQQSWYQDLLLHRSCSFFPSITIASTHFA